MNSAEDSDSNSNINEDELKQIKYTHESYNKIPPDISGIYRITNIASTRYYYGQTQCFKKRIASHYRKLRKNKHDNFFMQRDYNKFDSNPKNIIFEIIELCSVNQLDETEQIYLDKYWDNKQKCYNIAKDAVAPHRGCKLSEQSREKLRISSTGRKHSEETKKKMSKIKKGIKQPLHTCKCVYQYDLNGNYIQKFISISLAAKSINNNDIIENSIIKRLSSCANKNKNFNNNITYYSYGYVWTPEYYGNKIEVIFKKIYTIEEKKKHNETKRIALNKPETKEKMRKSSSGKKNSRAQKIKQYDLNGNFIKTWDYMSEAAKYINIKSAGDISLCCKRKKKSAHGFIWRFINEEF